MKLTVDRHSLAAVLGMAAKYVPTRTPIAALQTVLLRATGDTIEITTTDLDRMFKADLAARVETDGTVAVNASLLGAFVRSAAGPDIALELDETRLQARSGQARSLLPTIAATDFPEVFTAHSGDLVRFDIDGSRLADLLDSVRYSISTEETRYYLNGSSWMVWNGRLELASTNGHILSSISVDLPPGAEHLQPIIMPDFAMPPFAGAVNVETSPTFIRFSGTAGDTRCTVTSKLIDGTFPDYHRIVGRPVARATVKRQELAAAIGRCAPLCKVSRSPIDLIHDDAGQLLVRVIANDGSEVEDRIDIEGEQFTVTLADHLLATTLASFSGSEVEIGFAGIGEGLQFREPGKDHRLGLVMPQRGRVVQRIGPPGSAQVAA